jgi:hypothetical protein
VLWANFILQAALEADDGAYSATNDESIKKLNLIIVSA